MEHYDVLVVGNDVASLSAALFLARKMRKIAVFHDAASLTPKKDADDFVDAENQKYTFKYRPASSVPGLEGEGLLRHYLQAIGMENELKSMKKTADAVINQDGSFNNRVLTPEQFKVYLVRHYPKQRDDIHRFFRDLDRLYDNFVEQQENMLQNRDYTLTSLMIEWGDFSLKQVLDKYFTDPELVGEFNLFDSVRGLDLAEVNSYNFFMNFFIGLYHGVSYLYPNEQEIMKALIAKISVINPKFVQSRKIFKIVADASGKIVKVVDSTGKEIVAKYYIVASDPKDFYPKYFPDRTAELQEILKYYPNLDSRRQIQTLYICLNTKPVNAGVIDLAYYFKNNPEEPIKLTRLFNYKTFDPDSCGAKCGTLALDFVCDNGTEIQIPALLERVYGAFPKLAKAVIGTILGKPHRFLTMLSLPEVRKRLSINEQIAIEAGDHIKIFSNLYLVGAWLRPEAGVFGMFHAGIAQGDSIEERLYYGEDDDEFYYLTNDEIMMMMRHNYGKKPFGPKENHINFHIGKSDYFVRTKGKNITIHHGEYEAPDLTIYSTNDKLSNLLLKKVTFEDVLKSGGFKYKGKEEDLYTAINAFNLDDFQEYDNSYVPKTKIYFLGVKFLFIYILIWSILALLSNYLPLLWPAVGATVLIAFFTWLKYDTYKKISWFEVFLNGAMLTLLLMAIFWPAFNNLKKDDVLLGTFGLVFLVSGIIDKPIVHEFHKFDYRRDYAGTALFKVVNNGLTLVWALIFISILAFTYVTGERYVTVLYNLVFLGFFLTYFYPVMYITANIKK
jgi:phytoene dehydrogenase-like protein